MDTDAEVWTQQSVPSPQPVRSGVQVGRVVLGVLVVAAGIGWLLDESGLSVPWSLYPAAALTLIGLGMLVTLVGGRGRGLLVWLGVVALIAAVGVGVGADRYSGPVGDLVLAPTVTEWPVAERVSAGTITVDLTSHPLPENGTATVEIGAGRLVVTVPADDSRLTIDARTTAGTVRVDGVKVADGVDVRWLRPAAGAATIALHLQVGLGDIEVNHE